MENPYNRMVAAGKLEGALELSHEVMGEPFYSSILQVKRLSGAMDKLPVTIPGKLLPSVPLNDEKLILIQGQVRSYNKVMDGAGRLMVTLFAQSISEAHDSDTLNKATLVGSLCKPPVYRSTPFGREICDMMLAVNRGFGKSDYLPCIAWGRNAQYAARFRVGDKLKLTGRLQSREYQKLLENGEYIARVAYEISAFTLEAADGDMTAYENMEPVEIKTPPVGSELLFRRQV